MKRKIEQLIVQYGQRLIEAQNEEPENSYSWGEYDARCFELEDIIKNLQKILYK